MDKIKHYFKRLIQIIGRREMRILPGQLAFFMVLSLVPMATLLFFVFTNFSISLDTIVEFIENSFPSEVSEMIIPNINAPGSFFSVLFFMVTGFYIASNGLHSIIITSNVLYNIESGNFIKRRTKAIIMTLILIVLFIMITFVLAFGTFILKYILDLNIIRNFNEEVYHMINLIKWPISLFIIFITIKLLYTIAPDKPIPSKFMNRGAVVTTLGWSLVTSVYSYYVGNVANYGVLYGSLSNLVILMIYIYILAYIFVLGIIINTMFYERYKIN